MTGNHHGSPAARVSRRRVLTVAAAAGLGGSAVSMAGLGIARERRAAASAQPVVVSLRDGESGRFDVFAGSRRLELTDPDLAARLLELIARG